MENTLFFILKKLLKENEIKLDEKELFFQLQSHPSYPSLHSLTGVLDHFNIQNIALEVPCDIETLEKLPNVFISYLKRDGRDILVLTFKEKEKIKLVYDKGNEEIISTNSFFELWTGIFVAVEKDGNILVSSKEKANSLIKVVGGLTFAALITLFILLKPTLFSGLHFILSFLGLAISVVIVKHELGIHSKLADKVCLASAPKINCDDVLNSKAASFFGYFKLSDLGIVYFMSLVLAWVFIMVNQASFELIAIITILAIPFTFYSILYQYLKVKKWCLLCLSIVLTLWLQFGSLYFFNFKGISLSFSKTDILLVLTSFLISITIWSILSPRLKKEQELSKLKVEYLRFKRNYSLFSLMLNRAQPINIEVGNVKEIEYGSKDTPFKLVIVTNPLCSHCREVHRLVESIIAKWNNKVNILIRFNVSNKTDSPDTKIALRLLELFYTEGPEKCFSAMHDIYGQIAPELWLNKWGEAIDKGYIEELNKEKEWCLNNKIDFTPEILINGKPYPKEYKRSGLIYFIDEILEEVEQLPEGVEHEMANQL